MQRPALSKGSQDYETNPKLYPLTQPIPKVDSRKQTAGEAQYINDIPDMAGQMHAVFAKSKVGRADIEAIDTSAAIAMDGVVR